MKRILSIALLLSALAGTALAQSNVQAQNGGYVNAKTGDNTNSSGHVLTHQTNAAYLRTLAPTQILTERRIAAGAMDSTDVVDLSGYRTVALLVQCSFGVYSSADSLRWNQYAFQTRFHLGGASDSLSLFSIPVIASDSASVALRNSFSYPGVGTLGADEFPITILNSKWRGPTTTTALLGTPQGRVVYLTLPQGMAWPSNCSFRIRNIGRERAANPPLIRVWVMGTAL